MVLTHEMVHALKGDHTFTILGQFARAIYWINPLAWLALRHQTTERELACDESVLSSGTDKVNYAEQLVEITREICSRHPRSAVAMAYHPGFSRRINKVLDFQFYVKTLSHQAVRISLLIAVALTTPLATANIIQPANIFEFKQLVDDLYHGDKNQRAYAAAHLGFFGYRESFPYLIDALMDPNIEARIKAIKALRQLKDERAVDPLVNQLADPDPEVRYMSVWALGGYKTDEVIKVLFKTLRDEDAYVRQKAYLTLAEYGKLADTTPIITQLRAAEPSLREHSAIVLGKMCTLPHVRSHAMKEGKESVCLEGLRHAVSDPDNAVRAAAVESLGKLGDGRAAEALKSAL
ncbi:MAG: M56 family metallopeptidase, partial [Gammaproteobacteria bacterium]|nr:M56 family metallopeptidase [Gammaproteobacteria bacterium]